MRRTSIAVLALASVMFSSDADAGGSSCDLDGPSEELVESDPTAAWAWTPECAFGDLEGVNLAGADLKWAWLEGANMAGADLAGADLRSSNLEGANLRGANMAGADLSVAFFHRFDREDWRTSLKDADLRGANLRGANLAYVNLEGANLEGAILRGAKNCPATSWSLLYRCQE